MTRFSRAKARVSTQRWQFFARLGSMLWVVVDTVMSAMGKNLPGRRRSLDPAIPLGRHRDAASNRTPKSVSTSARQEKQRLEQERDEKLKQLGSELQRRPA